MHVSEECVEPKLEHLLLRKGEEGRGRRDEGREGEGGRVGGREGVGGRGRKTHIHNLYICVPHLYVSSGSSCGLSSSSDPWSSRVRDARAELRNGKQRWKIGVHNKLPASYCAWSSR